MEQFSYVKRGYNPQEVDAYISTLEQVIKSYKDKDNAIKNAIISAQVAADNIMKNAHMQAADHKYKINRQLQAVRDSVEKQRVRLQAFQDVYNNMLRKYLKDINENDMKEIYGKLDEMEILLDELSESDSLEEPNDSEI